jgi:hypothetical protein
MDVPKHGVLIGCIVVAVAVVAHALIGRDSSRYQIAAAGADGATLWRLDVRTGAVSVCGATATGRLLSQALAHYEAEKGRAVDNMMASPDAVPPGLMPVEPDARPAPAPPSNVTPNVDDILGRFNSGIAAYTKAQKELAAVTLPRRPSARMMLRLSDMGPPHSIIACAT